MTKRNFTYLVVGIVFGLLFALGMCMCLLPEWNSFTPGVVLTGIGLAGLIALAVTIRRQSGKKLHINPKTAGLVLYGTCSALVMGLGMCMILVWQLMIPGIVVGIAGIVMLLFLIPMITGFKEE